VRELHGQPAADQDPRRVLGEHPRVLARVVADHDRPLRIRGVCEQVVGEPGGDLAHDDAVHPVGSAPEHAAQPGGAELQRPDEPVGEIGDRGRITGPGPGERRR
jgi:hypothetical protein